MAGPFLTKKGIVLAQTEDDYATDPGSWLGSHVIDTDQDTVELGLIPELEERPFSATTFTKQVPVITNRAMEVAFTVELKGSGEVGTPPRIGPLLKASRFLEDINPTDVTYSLVTPFPATANSVALKCYTDAAFFLLLGARGNLRVLLPTGKRLLGQFRFRGIYAGPVAGAIPTLSREGTAALLGKSTTVTVLGGALTRPVSNIEFDLQNELVDAPDPSKADAIQEVYILDGTVIGSLDPAIKQASDLTGDITLWDGRTKNDFSYVVGAAGNKLTISGKGMVINEPSLGDRGGARIFTHSFGMYGDTGDDELELKFE
jgi:hypothetical protein